MAILLALAGTGLIYSFKSPQPQKKVLWYQVTVIESVVQGGAGRSRMISQDENGQMEETKIENLFSLAGINFGNVRENDQQITNKITELTNDGWELGTVTTGVYDGGRNGGTGIFMTRYLFKKEATE
jgi:hypothetical protein